MAIYRQVRQSFWTDSKVVDDFTPEDRYFYLYLMTNPHTNLCGCYELSFKQASDETGYTRETIERLIDRLEHTHDVIRYSKQTKELLIVKWSEYNWTKSPDFRKPLLKNIEGIKDDDFKAYLMDIFEGNDTVSRPSCECVKTTVSVSVTDTVSVSNSVSVTDNAENIQAKEILELYRLHCPSLPAVKCLNEKRKKSIKALLKEFSIEDIINGFKKAEMSDFCKGLKGDWRADFEFLINKNNMIKVLEGKYDNRDVKQDAGRVNKFLNA